MVLVDTGFWLALANRNDDYHSRAAKVLETLKEPLVTTWPVMTETCHLLLMRLGVDAEINFVRSYKQRAFEVRSLSEIHADRIYHLMKQYSNLPMDLADASLVILAEELGEGLILSTDERDFKTYRFKNHKPFKNLLIE